MYTQPAGTPMLPATIILDTLRPNLHNSKRSGTPRYQWAASALDLYWLIIRDGTPYKYTTLDWDNPAHIQLMHNALRAAFLPKPQQWPYAAQQFNPSR